MGIKGFHKFCETRIPDSYRTINIMDSLENYRRETGKNPVLIINMKTLWNLDRRQIDGLYGFRYNVAQRKIEKFLGKLKDANVKMIFPFHKNFTDVEGFTKEWHDEDGNYMGAISVLNKIDQLKSKTSIRKSYENSGNAFWFPRDRAMEFAEIEIAKKYGELVGPSGEFGYAMCDQNRLAVENSALAIVGYDSYYLVHESKWKYWASNDLDFDNMTISEYDKDQILRHLGLNYHHMPLFDVLTGSRLMDAKYIKRVRHYFGPNNFLFENAAHYISSIPTYPLTNGILDDISREIFINRRDSENFFIFMKSILDSFRIRQSNGPVNELLAIVQNDYNNYGFEILSNTFIYVSPLFLDLRKNDMKPLRQLVLPILKKTCGVILKHKEDFDMKFRMCLKENHSDPMAIQNIQLTFPDFEIPDIKNLLTGNISDEKKYELLLWITGLDLLKNQLKSIPRDYFFIILSLVFLNTNDSLARKEAVAILQTLIQEKNQPIPEEIEYPEEVSSRALRASTIFLKIFRMFQCCFAPIGFKNYNFELPFDGVYFQKHLRNLAEIDETNETLFDLLMQEVLRPFEPIAQEN